MAAVSLLFSILYLIPRISGIQYYRLWMAVCMIMQYPVFFISLLYIARLVHQKDIQIISLSAFAVLFDRILFDDLMYFRLVKSISIYFFLDVTITLVTAYFLYSIKENSTHRVVQKTNLPGRTPSSTSTSSPKRNNPSTSARTTALPNERKTAPIKQPMTSHCRYCGASISEGNTICRRCYTERTAKKECSAHSGAYEAKFYPAVITQAQYIQ